VVIPFMPSDNLWTAHDQETDDQNPEVP